MRRFVKHFTLALFVCVFVALLATTLSLATSLFVDISFRTPRELGEEVVVTFPSFVPGSVAKRLFTIRPAIDGELAWVEEAHELHFVPSKGFEPPTRYRVTVGFAPSLLSSLSLPTTTLVFQSELAPTSSKTENIYTPAPAKGKFIDANLATMKLTLFEDGQATRAYPVAAKGNPRSAPTREGQFSVLSKQQNHFSTLSHVWMPWSMQFSGDYFIHQWPYWPNGTRITSAYSAGCIRLFEGDAKEVFEWAQVGTPLVVHSTPAHVLFEDLHIGDGDLVREIGDYRVYIVKLVGDKRFKRHVFTEEMALWYPHLHPFKEHVKVLPEGTLSAYETSRWIRLGSTSVLESEEVFEIDANGAKHSVVCGNSTKCFSVWSEYGWDPDEIFSVSQVELNWYAQGAPKPLLPAVFSIH